MSCTLRPALDFLHDLLTRVLRHNVHMDGMSTGLQSLWDSKRSGSIRTRGLLIFCLLIVVDLTVSPKIHAATHSGDVAALNVFQRAIQDPLNRLANWVGDDPCGDQWEGVFCSIPIDGLSRVTELRLLNHNLSGQLTPELGNMDSLQILDIMWNQFSGSIPKELGQLKQLTLLLLNGNNLTGSIPDELGGLTLLDRFQIDSNQISGPIPISFRNLINIKHLHMNNNSLSGNIPQELGSLPNLLHLLADTNNLEGLIPYQLANISTLKILQLDNNNFTSATIPLEFSNMVNIKKLSLRNCNLQGELPDLSRLVQLEYLDLSQNKLEGEIPSNFLQNMTTIDLSSNLLHGTIPANFGTLSSLQFLALRSNNLSGPIPESFGTGASFTSSNGQILLDFQNNSFSSIPTNLTDAANFRANLLVWVHGNMQICKSNDSLIHRLCIDHAETFFAEMQVNDNNYSPSCDPETCSPGEEPIPSVFYNEGLCRCALPIVVGYRLKSPSFSFFTPFITGYEQWIAEGLSLPSSQVYLDSFIKEPGPRFATVIKIFPPASGSRLFSESDLLRIFEIFSGWKMPPNDFYGPQELLFFNYSLYQGNTKAISTYKQNRKMIIGVLLGCALGTMLIVAPITYFLIKSGHCKFGMQRAAGQAKRSGKSEGNRKLLRVAGVKEFSFRELDIATKAFSNEMLVGQGGYGHVYHGVLNDGSEIAIKRSKHGSCQGQEEFHNEIELLSRVHHRNLVSLVGFCLDNDEQMLVYEYIPNGTLRDHLSGSKPVSSLSHKTEEYSLNFAARLRVAISAARGINYLHTEAKPPILHRDIKASNILLDSCGNARVADFGLSKLAPTPDIDGSAPAHYVSTVVKGTPGYLDPEYFLTHKLTDKSDVYSFGVVLLELVTGMQPIENGKNIVREVKQAYDNGNILSIVDARMGPYPAEALEALVRLAFACCDDDAHSRPSMTDVLHDLQGIWDLLACPEALDIDTESAVNANPYLRSIHTKKGSLHASVPPEMLLSLDDTDESLMSTQNTVQAGIEPR